MDNKNIALPVIRFYGVEKKIQIQILGTGCLSSFVAQIHSFRIIQDNAFFEEISLHIGLLVIQSNKITLGAPFESITFENLYTTFILHPAQSTMLENLNF